MTRWLVSVSISCLVPVVKADETAAVRMDIHSELVGSCWLLDAEPASNTTMRARVPVRVVRLFYGAEYSAVNENPQAYILQVWATYDIK